MTLVSVQTTDSVSVFIAQNIDKILTLMQTGFFDMHNGSVTTHFSQDGSIRKVERHDVFTF